jgi:hypothetical protein
MRRLDKAARERGQSRQAFVEGAVLAELSEHEERRHAKRNAHSLRSDTKKEERSSSSERVGLGIGDTLRKRLEVTEEEERPASSAQAPVIVNVGSAAGSAPNSDIDRLAAYVANGAERGRETRLRTAVAVLVASASTDEERKVLAARLDEAVAVKTKAPAASDDGSGVKRIARIAFDKLSDFWEGES